ncbi:hypothetical protein NUSPORA_02666 [Nucleospora cyclopteri]
MQILKDIFAKIVEFIYVALDVMHNFLIVIPKQYYGLEITGILIFLVLIRNYLPSFIEKPLTMIYNKVVSVKNYILSFFMKIESSENDNDAI